MGKKSNSFTSHASPPNAFRKKALHVLHAEPSDSEEELKVEFVKDINSLMPPMYNADTRTYFKCSIYSPSNRLYTVNEEVNSTQSEVGCAPSDAHNFSSLRCIKNNLQAKFKESAVRESLESLSSSPSPMDPMKRIVSGTQTKATTSGAQSMTSSMVLKKPQCIHGYVTSSMPTLSSKYLNKAPPKHNQTHFRDSSSGSTPKDKRFKNDIHTYL